MYLHKASKFSRVHPPQVLSSNESRDLPWTVIKSIRCRLRVQTQAFRSGRQHTDEDNSSRSGPLPTTILPRSVIINNSSSICVKRLRFEVFHDQVAPKHHRISPASLRTDDPRRYRGDVGSFTVQFGKLTENSPSPCFAFCRHRFSRTSDSDLWPR